MKSRYPKAVLLDLDDTILAFDSVADMSWRIVLAKHEDRFVTSGLDTVFRSMKSSARLFWSDPVRHRAGRLDLTSARQVIISEALHNVGVTDDELTKCIAAEYDRVRTDAIHPILGAVETVEEMRENRVKLALITNGAATSQREKLNRFGLARLFDCILIEGEFGCGKPDERVYIKALSDLHVSAADAWMVGDNWEWEVATPQRLGMKGVWVNPQNAEIPNNGRVQPFRVVNSLAELMDGTI